MKKVAKFVRCLKSLGSKKIDWCVYGRKKKEV